MIESLDITQILLSVIATLVGMLVALVAFGGRRVFIRMDRIQDVLRQAEKDIYARIDDHEHRLTRVETHHELRGRPSKGIG